MSYIPLSPNHHVVVVFKTKENEEETYLSLKRRSISSLLKLKANKTLTINGTFLLHVKFNNKGTIQLTVKFNNKEAVKENAFLSLHRHPPSLLRGNHLFLSKQHAALEFKIDENLEREMLHRHLFLFYKKPSAYC